MNETPPISPVLEYILERIEKFDMTHSGNEGSRNLGAAHEMLKISSKYLDFSFRYGEDTFYDICVKKIDYERNIKNRSQCEHDNFERHCKLFLDNLKQYCQKH